MSAASSAPRMSFDMFSLGRSLAINVPAPNGGKLDITGLRVCHVVPVFTTRRSRLGRAARRGAAYGMSLARLGAGFLSGAQWAISCWLSAFGARQGTKSALSQPS